MLILYPVPASGGLTGSLWLDLTDKEADLIATTKNFGSTHTVELDNAGRGGIRIEFSGGNASGRRTSASR
ncbi:hypothetical protein YK56LOC_31600 [Caballeronia sp. HLA56]